MRFLQLSNRLSYPARDGGAIAMLNMTHAFHALGHKVVLLSLNTNKHYYDVSKLPGNITQLADIKAVDINTDVTAGGAIASLLKGNSYNISRFYSKAFEKELIKTLQEQEFDIIHLEGLHISIYLDTIRKYSKAPVVMRAHNVEYIIWERLAQTEKNPLKKWYLGILAKRLKNYELKVMNRLDAIIPITENDAEIFRNKGCKVPLFVSPTGLNLEDYPLQLDNTEWPSLFHLGALDWMPNQQAVKWFLEEIWPELVRKFPNLKFYLAGRHMPQWLYELKQEGVVIIGEVESAVEFMNSKAIMVVPLQSGSGMRIKIIEGMALAKTIISTSVGAEGIEYTDGHDIIIADDKRSFIKHISYCLENRAYAEKSGLNARHLIEEKYTNLKLVEKLVEFYKKHP